jgi:hypothetical protein
MNYREYLEIRKNNKTQIEKFFKSFKYRYLENIIFDDGRSLGDQRLSGFNNIWDAVPAAIHGLVPMSNRIGADAFYVTSIGRIVDVELKLVSVNSSLVRKGPRGGLFTVPHKNKNDLIVDKNKTAALETTVGIQFSKQVKNHIPRNTILTIYDQHTSSIVGSYIIFAPVMKKVLTDMPTSKAIHLSTFKKVGVPLKPYANIPFKCWDDYRSDLANSILETTRKI